MLPIQDEVSRAAQEHVSLQLAVATTVLDTMVDGLRQYSDLNAGMCRASMEQGSIAVRELVSAPDARRFMSVLAGLLPSSASRSVAYGCRMACIFAGIQASAFRAASVIPETRHDWKRLAGQMGDPFSWRFTLSLLREVGEGAFRLPSDVARAARLAVNTNVPAWNSGKLRIAYSGPGRSGR